ncbi:MAG: Rv3235 family protein [Propionibacteriaceae bacterium]|jgi:hypothetical protein|nr:Rv3235 family protein [Propionibacteriaceae bacterium]
MDHTPPHCALICSKPGPTNWRWPDHWSDQPSPTSQPAAPLAPAGTGYEDETGGRAAALARRWASTMVEALNGHRPLTQLAVWFDPDQCQVLTRAARDCRAAGGARLAGLRAQSIRPDRVEIALALLVPPKVRAVALSLARQDQAWHCADLVFG